MVGLPRGIHRNFQAWREGDEVWLCPTDRVGPVYRFVFEGGAWKFDGLVGLLRPGGRVEPAARPSAISLKFRPGTSGLAASRCLGYKARAHHLRQLEDFAQGRAGSSPRIELERPARPSSPGRPGDIGNS